MFLYPVNNSDCKIYKTICVIAAEYSIALNKILYNTNNKNALNSESNTCSKNQIESPGRVLNIQNPEHKSSTEKDFELLLEGLLAYINQYLLSTEHEVDNDWHKAIDKNDRKFFKNIANSLKEFWLTNFDPNNIKENIITLNRCDLIKRKKIFESDSRSLNRIINSIVATNFFLFKDYISYKFTSTEPNIFAEIFVYSKDFEGLHIRGGKMSRGGIRWSNRNDYRVELKDLFKAQVLKNSIILPTGAKGAFFIKNENTGSIEKYYKQLICGMLDVTDLEIESKKNILNNSDTYDDENCHVANNISIIKYFEHDPYLVVAADRGTASFSDAANEISKEYGFWLGDAFASGGHTGYSHKGLGITSKGCFESFKNHTNTIGLKLGEDIISVIGIGDMHGDVFGNGLLLYNKYKLMAAFSSKFIFLDPNPNIEDSFRARKYMFDNQLSWDKYPIETAEVYSRKQTQIEISEDSAKMLGLTKSTNINEVIKAILKLPADVMWSGGVGTYIKSSIENNEDALDPVNDDVRINANDLNVKILIEGANLSITQLGRIEAGINSIRLNTDFIDNSGGVNCSDLEVNIKILLYHVGINEIEVRNIIKNIENEVVELVLDNNRAQNNIINIYEKIQTTGTNFDNLEFKSDEVISLYKNFANFLIEKGILDSKFIENYNKRSNFIKNRNKDLFTRSEIAVLLASAKIFLKSSLSQHVFADEIVFKCLNQYYPKQLINLLLEKGINILENPIRQEIARNIVVNNTLNITPAPLIFRNNQSNVLSLIHL